MHTATQLTGATNLPVTMRIVPYLDSNSGTDYFAFVRNGGIDAFNSLTQDTSSDIILGYYTSSNVSGTAGDAGYLVTFNANAYFAANAEL